MSAMRPKRPSGISLAQTIFNRLRHQTLHAFRVFDWTRRDPVDANPITSPLHREIARQRINTSFRCRHVKLHRRAEIMERGADVQNLAAMLFQLCKRRATDVERAFQVDVNHGAKAVWRQLFRRAEKVSRGAVNDDIDLAKLFDRLCNGLLDASGWRTSAATGIALPPSSLIASAAGCRWSSLRLTSATLAPASANARATPP